MTNPETIPALPRPVITDPDQAEAIVLAGISAVEAAALSGYSEGERASWPTQLAEAAAFRGTTEAAVLAGTQGSDGTDLTLAPFLTDTCAAQLGDADDTTRLVQVNALAVAVMVNAKSLADLSQALIGLRRRAFAAIEAAQGTDVQVALTVALSEIAAL